MAEGQFLDRVLLHYDLGELRACRRTDHGHVNESWIFETTTDRYFLKRRHPHLRRPGLVSAQHALIRHLCSVGFPAPTIVPTRRGATFLQLEDEIYEVHEYIPGEHCDITRPAHLATAARTLGWYHDAVSGFDHPLFHRPSERYGPTALAQIVGRLLDAWRGRTSSQLDPLIEKLEDHTRDLAARFIKFGQLPELVIHGDYYAGNLIFQGDGMASVVDYDLAHWCSRAMELAEALIYFAAQRPGNLKHVVYPGVLDPDAVHHFLVAYAEVVTLSESEIRALPHMMRAIWLCASLDPPLESLLSLEAAPQALPEVLTLAGWAQAHAPDIVGIGLAAVGRET